MKNTGTRTSDIIPGRSIVKWWGIQFTVWMVGKDHVYIVNAKLGRRHVVPVNQLELYAEIDTTGAAILKL